MRFLWATRGFDWGFRFVEDADLPDPLPAYEAAFHNLTSDCPAFRADPRGLIAVRFCDPGGRTDFAGRLIPHEFVFLTPPPSINSWESARDAVWPTVAETYAKIWRSSEKPTSN